MTRRSRAPSVSSQFVSQKPAQKRRKKNKDRPDIAPEEPEAYSESEPSPSTAEASSPPQSRTYNLGGRLYAREDDLAGRNTKKKSSMVWERGFAIIDVLEPSRRVYYCIQCHESKKPVHLFACKPSTGTKTILEHHRIVHKIDKHGEAIKPIGSIGEHVATGRGGGGVRTEVEVGGGSGSFGGLVWWLNFALFKSLLIRWLVYSHIAYFQVENLYFIALLRYLNDSLAKLLPKRTTIRGWVMAEFYRRKRLLRRELRKSRSNINLSFDMWSSPNYIAIIAINAHWIDQTGKKRTTLLAIREVHGEHTGENMASVVLKVIKDYKIGRKVGYFVLDNAANNDTCVEAIMKKLHPEFSEKQRRRRRLRCLGHVINLAAQVFILGKNAENVLTEMQLHEIRGDFDALQKKWKENGALGRLHNLVKYIRMTPERRAEFRKCVVEGDKFNHLEVSFLQS